MEAEREGSLPGLARLVLLVEHVHERRQVACCNCATVGEESRGDGRVGVPRLTMLGRVYASQSNTAASIGCSFHPAMLIKWLMMALVIVPETHMSLRVAFESARHMPV